MLHALAEAGVKIDLVAGHGIGAVGAVFAAIDGGARLWDANGLWRRASVARLYGWRDTCGWRAGASRPPRWFCWCPLAMLAADCWSTAPPCCSKPGLGHGGAA